MVHEVELSSIPTLDISVGVTVNGQNLHPLICKDEEFRLYIKTVKKIVVLSNIWKTKIQAVFVSLNLNKVYQKDVLKVSGSTDSHVIYPGRNSYISSKLAIRFQYVKKICHQITCGTSKRNFYTRWIYFKSRYKISKRLEMQFLHNLIFLFL